MNKRPTVQEIRSLRSRLADAKADKASLASALNGLMEALAPGKGTLTDELLSSYDTARSVLQRLGL